MFLAATSCALTLVTAPVVKIEAHTYVSYDEKDVESFSYANERW